MPKSPKSAKKKKHSVASVEASSVMLKEQPHQRSWAPPPEAFGEKVLFSFG